MSAGARAETDVDDLLRLAIADPDQAEGLAARLIASTVEPLMLSVAHQTRAIVWRDAGRIGESITELALALRFARTAGDKDRQADVRASLGVALAMAGRPRAGLDHLRRAIADAGDPDIVARVRLRRANVHYFYLDHAEAALDDLVRALPILHEAGDRVWEARTLSVLGLTYLALGRTEEAAHSVREAAGLFAEEGQDREAVVTLHNQGWIAFCGGDLPGCLSLYDQAAERYSALGEDRVALVKDRCEALLAAGLSADAVDLVAKRVRAGSFSAAEHAELLLALSMAELADGDAAASLKSATEARTMFRRQGREWGADRAELTALLARNRTGARGRRLVESAAAVGHRLHLGGSDEAAVAWLLAGTAALSAGLSTGMDLLDQAAQFRHGSTGLVRATGWRALALKRDALGDSRGVLIACRRGLDVAGRAPRARLGSSELRALAARHGDQLAALALRQAVRRGSTRAAGVERAVAGQRAVSATGPPTRRR